MATTPKTMSTNVGGMERMLRVIAGIAILVMGPGLGSVSYTHLRAHET